MHRFKFLVVCFLLLQFANRAMAWSVAGHMATASIAYRVLKKDSPGTIPKMIAILKATPRYEEKWKAEIEQLGGDVDPDEYLFMMSARWADDVRRNFRYYPNGGTEAMQHYINLPFKPEGQPDSVAAPEPPDVNIRTAYPIWLEKFKNTEAPEKRAIAACWVMHLIGDAHQPLHSVSLFTEKFQVEDKGVQVGDRGGTRFYVRPRNKAVGLHSIWDGLITEDSKYRENRNVVIKLMSNPKHAQAKFAGEVTILSIQDWILESHALAREKAYMFEGKLLEGSTEKTEAPRLPSGYFAVVEPVAKRRGVLAGYRMAAVLQDALGK